MSSREGTRYLDEETLARVVVEVFTGTGDFGDCECGPGEEKRKERCPHCSGCRCRCRRRRRRRRCAASCDVEMVGVKKLFLGFWARRAVAGPEVLFLYFDWAVKALVHHSRPAVHHSRPAPRQPRCRRCRRTGRCRHHTPLPLPLLLANSALFPRSAGAAASPRMAIRTSNARPPHTTPSHLMPPISLMDHNTQNEFYAHIQQKALPFQNPFDRGALIHPFTVAHIRGQPL